MTETMQNNRRFIRSLLFNYALFLLPGLLSVLASCNRQEHRGMTVHFPDVSEPVQITGNGKDHLLASYYGINSFDLSQRYVTVLQTNIRFELPDEDDPATLGLVDLETHEFIPLTQTRAWNFQQGNMAHWLGTSPDSLIIYNDYRDGQFVSIIMNVHTKEEVRSVPHPVSAVSPDGKQAISINFSRLRHTRPDYGYGGDAQNARMDTAFPDDDGLFLIDLETGEATLLVSYADIAPLVPPIEEGSVNWFNHTLFSREGSKVFWLSRQLDENGRRITSSFTVNTDGTELQRSFPDGWGGSHYDWLNDEELMITAQYEGKNWGHILFTVGDDDYRRLGNGLLDYDGHGHFSPDERWMITDTYPRGQLREQHIYLMDMESEAVLPLGRYPQPAEFRSHWRCDIHPRWSPGGDLIGFNSTHTGSRQVYLFRLQF